MGWPINFNLYEVKMPNCPEDFVNLLIFFFGQSLSILPCPRSLATVLVFPTAGLPVKIIL